MVRSFAAFQALRSIESFFPKRSIRTFESAFQDLLERLRQRLYLETIPALAFYWMETVDKTGCSVKQLDHLLKSISNDQLRSAPFRELIREIETYSQNRAMLADQRLGSTTSNSGPMRTWVQEEGGTAYIIRLLNDWLPKELARMFFEETESTLHDSGLPALTIAAAIQRLLDRERLSCETLEMLLKPGLLSPESVYPADLEVLRDVVLCLLGRTGGPTPPMMPATLLCVAPHSHLPTNYKEAVRHARAVRPPNRDEIHVPIETMWALDRREGDRLNIGSILVTMDGRWWEAEKLLYDEQHLVVYRPVGRLRINHSSGLTSLRIPWLENRLRWSGDEHFADLFQIFGREWRISNWEVDAERTWLNLVFSRALSISEIDVAVQQRSWRLRPATIDIAWAALESALMNSLAQKSGGPIESLRHSDLIPIGRAMLGLAESVAGRFPKEQQLIETQLKALRYLENPVNSSYGRIPWRIVPINVRATLLGLRRDPVIAGLLCEVFDGLPKTIPPKPDDSTSFNQGTRSTSSPHAA
jgi:hypothetical protein